MNLSDRVDQVGLALADPVIAVAAAKHPITKNNQVACADQKPKSCNP